VFTSIYIYDWFIYFKSVSYVEGGESMKNLFIIFISFYLNLSFCLGVTEAEVQEVVNSQGKETVAGNLFIWFLCAIAFLKISQKIDSVMNSLGLNVGRTGGSFLGEAMIVTRTLMSGGKSIGHAIGSTGMKFSGISKLGSMAGGLGFIEKKFGSSVANDLVTSDSSMTGFGAKMYSASLGEAGGFASKVIGSIAHGKASENGVIKGERAIEAFSSYIPQASNNMSIANTNSISLDASSGDTINADDIFDSQPVYSNIEIGGGRITGYENLGDGSKEFIMYSSEKYLKPEGEYQAITSSDGATWYKQYAEPTIKKIPLSEENGKVKYTETIEHKLPKNPGIIDRV